MRTLEKRRHPQRLRRAIAAIALAAATHAQAAVPDPIYPLLSPLNLLSFYLSPTNTEAMMADEAANRHFLPDWNHNGIYGEQADLDIEKSGEEVVGPFRYPCLDALDGSVTFETLSGSCVADGTVGAVWRTGEARRQHFISAAGSRLFGTIFIPHQALVDDGARYPSLIFTNGGIAPARMYYMYTMAAARRGYLGFNYDLSGQGNSEGQPRDVFSGPAVEKCPQTHRSCHEQQDVVRWFTGQPLLPYGDDYGRWNPAYAPAGDNPYNPVLNKVDPSRLAIGGQSFGSHLVMNYAWFEASGLGADGHPLPQVSAVLALSGTETTHARTAIQHQTADLDLPFPPPGTMPHFEGSNGPVGGKQWYEDLRATAAGGGELQQIVIEAGSHGDTTPLAQLPRVAWSQAVSTHYALNFLDCHVQGDAQACGRARTPMPGLSRGFASEYDPDGPAGPSKSRCITVPDKATLSQLFYHPENFLWGLIGQPKYDCTP